MLILFLDASIGQLYIQVSNSNSNYFKASDKYVGDPAAILVSDTFCAYFDDNIAPGKCLLVLNFGGGLGEGLFKLISRQV